MAATAKTSGNGTNLLNKVVYESQSIYVYITELDLLNMAKDSSQRIVNFMPSCFQKLVKKSLKACHELYLSSFYHVSSQLSLTAQASCFNNPPGGTSSASPCANVCRSASSIYIYYLHTKYTLYAAGSAACSSWTAPQNTDIFLGITGCPFAP